MVLERHVDPLRRTCTVGLSRSLTFTVSNDGGGAARAHQVEAADGRDVHRDHRDRRGHHHPGRAAASRVSFASRLRRRVPASGTWELTGTDGTGLHVVGFSGTGVGRRRRRAHHRSGGWQLNGAAALSGSNLILTPNAATSPARRSGRAWSPPRASASTFDETIDQGTGADGLTFTFADPALGALPTSLGGDGRRPRLLRASPAWRSPSTRTRTASDPSGNFMGIATGGVGADIFSIWPPTPPCQRCETTPAAW